MYPLKQPQLCLGELARQWQRFIHGSPPINEVDDRLLAGFWRGQLVLRGGDGRTPLGRETSLEVLRDAVARTRGFDTVAHCLAFWETNEEAELGPRERALPDGGLDVDLRKRIQLPEARADWSEQILTSAFASLAEVGLTRLPIEFRAGMLAQRVLKSDFALFCDLNGYARPAFWFGPSEGRSQDTSLPELVRRAGSWSQTVHQR